MARAATTHALRSGNDQGSHYRFSRVHRVSPRAAVARCRVRRGRLRRADRVLRRPFETAATPTAAPELRLQRTCRHPRGSHTLVSADTRRKKNGRTAWKEKRYEY